MAYFQKGSLFLLRIGLGVLMLYAGITKVLDPTWSAAGYLNAAKTFPGFYHALAAPSVLPIINGINAWGLTLLGVSLLLGVLVRWSSIFGAILMLLYYFPILEFPYPNPHSFVVDEHIIYALSLLVLAAYRAECSWGTEGHWFTRRKETK